ncbi:hypothetical protein HYALB_00008782 [Hymenoscyphus albidus]|uniref:Uncharacterized protein n=1 Tax=Hymenoscyphus albidus TaxID=595503 RepID=A0A9N9LVM8_9HELO|nr:hypothetical protein HYALB_00008782 [Hymenoscyphus albidus]
MTAKGTGVWVGKAALQVRKVGMGRAVLDAQQRKKYWTGISKTLLDCDTSKVTGNNTYIETIIAEQNIGGVSSSELGEMFIASIQARQPSHLPKEKATGTEQDRCYSDWSHKEEMKDKSKY